MAEQPNNPNQDVAVTEEFKIDRRLNEDAEKAAEKAGNVEKKFDDSHHIFDK
jgi:hypothetical protein